MKCPHCGYLNPEKVKSCLDFGYKGSSPDLTTEEKNSLFYEFASFVDMVPRVPFRSRH